MDNDNSQTPSTVPQQTFNTPLPTSPPIEPHPTKRSRLPIIVFFLLVLALGAGIGGYVYGKSSSLPSSEPAITNSITPADWQPLPSSKKGFPVLDDSKQVLTYYSVEEAKVISLDSIKLSLNIGSSTVKGSGRAVASPNLNHIAYVGDDYNLWLFSVETQEKKQLTTSGLVTYISSWSPDSKNILYYFDHKTIANSIFGIDAPMKERVSFKPQVEQGYYQTNIETGKVTPLAPIDNTVGYLDNNTLLVKVDSDSDKLATFKIDTLEADLSTVKVEASFGVGQFDFSPDGRKWAFSNPISKTDPTKSQQQLVFGDFPSATTVIDSGKWAEMQWPIFSPDSKRIIYQKTTATIGGYPQNQAWLYDIDSGAKKAAGEGSPLRWIDDRTILVRTSWDQTGQKFALLDVETGKVTEI